MKLIAQGLGLTECSVNVVIIVMIIKDAVESVQGAGAWADGPCS